MQLCHKESTAASHGYKMKEYKWGVGEEKGSKEVMKRGKKCGVSEEKKRLKRKYERSRKEFPHFSEVSNPIHLQFPLV